MPLFDLDRPALERYRPDVSEPTDFDAFWADTLAEARRFDPALFSVGLMHPICPPSTVCAAYNRNGARAGGVVKSIEVHEFNEHEGGGGHQAARQLPWLAALAHGVPTAGQTGSGAR